VDGSEEVVGEEGAGCVAAVGFCGCGCGWGGVTGWPGGGCEAAFVCLAAEGMLEFVKRWMCGLTLEGICLFLL
jgi:hypothetical protein